MRVDDTYFITYQFRIEDQDGVWRDDAARAAFAVSQLRRDNQLYLPTDFHQGDALIPAFDHAPGPKFELDWLAAVDGRVEYFSIREFASVVQPSRSCPPQPVRPSRRSLRCIPFRLLFSWGFLFQLT
jgi:hypothetical protein